MSLHSPLPWVIYSDRGDIKSSCKGLPEVPVAKVLGQETSGERQANAELIIRSVNALPGLVKALEDLVSECKNPGDGGDFEEGEWPALDRARAELTAIKERSHV